MPDPPRPRVPLWVVYLVVIALAGVCVWVLSKVGIGGGYP